MIKINWLDKQSSKKLYFKDLKPNQGFKIISPLSQGVVYIKVVKTNKGFGAVKIDEYAYEVGTGALWEPTKSEVQVVDLEININAKQPEIYDGI